MLEDKTKVDAYTYEPPAITALTLKVKDLTDGHYQAHWFEPQAAVYLRTETIRVGESEVTLNVPTFNKDLALKLELE
jgi:hypothetical protein